MRSPTLVMVRLAARYRVERALSRLGVGGAAGLALAGLVHYAGGGTPGLLLGIGTGLAMGVAAAWLTERSMPVNGRTVARHLDRAVPELEESATLLLAPAGSLGSLAELQRARVERRWDSLKARATLPHSDLRRAMLASPLLALAGTLLLLLPPSPHGIRAVWSEAGEEVRLTLRTLDVEVTPPAYTGLSPRHATGPDIEAEEGARLDWALSTAGPVDAAWLIPSSGDSLRLLPDGYGTWRVASRADRSLLMRVRLRHGEALGLTSDDYRLAVRPDRPPVLTIVRPEERTSHDPGSLPRVAVEVLANDDYGVDSIAIAATIASGRGEAVVFRRLRLPFTDRRRREGGGELLGATLDLPALGLGAGDELYFEVEATDRKAPVPNRSRSETVFLSVRDSSHTPTTDLARLAIGAQPEYFRGQRQLIIDTERLLADQASLPPDRFRERANELGMDQGLLRLRYGQFLGEEYEEELQPMGGREHAAADAAPGGPPAPAPGDEVPASLPETDAGEASPAKAADRYAHRHDDAENATLLGKSVKDKLRAAVGAMWRAELHLRTAEPKRALPFMYQALELIKLVQQDARVYVQRVGFDPPPIEVGRLRLTGKLKDIRDRAVEGGWKRRDSLPGVRAALALLLGEGPRVPERPSLEAALARAGRELTDLAVDDPRLLPVLRDLRQLTDSLARGAACAGCLVRVTQGLWSALPPAEPGLGTVPTGGSPLARRFAALLGGRSE